jgi:NADH-quinone oxidoreductase subunit N
MMQEFNLLQSLPVIAPEIGLTVMAVVVLFLDLSLPESQRRSIAIVTALGLIATAVLTVAFWSPTPAQEGLYWGGLMRYDILAEIFKVMALAAGALTALITIDVPNMGRKGEFYLIIIVATLGACLLAGASDLIMIFLALETMTIPLYILAAFDRQDKRSSESGMKYFLFGSFASGIMLYGLSLLYGFTGQTNIYAIAGYLGSEAFAANLIPVLVALTLIFVGFGFKISAAPFHFWTPDVYEGAPTPVTAFLSVASKSASFALLIRFFVAVFPGGLVLGGTEVQPFWINLAIAIAVLSMTFGNLVALGQTNIKRLLAYSSIAQAGYALVGVAALGSVAAREDAVAAVTFYMLMYTFTNLLAFGVIILVTQKTGSERIGDFAGLSKRSPWLALTMTIAFLSLAGVPPAAGFFGKFLLFQAAVEADLTWLAIVGVLNSIIAPYYYLVVIKVMYVDKSADEDVAIAVNRPYAWALGAATLVVVLLGTFAIQPIFDWAARGARSIFNL